MYASIEEIKNKIVDRLEVELQITDPNYNRDLLTAKVEDVLDEAQSIRNYDGYSDDFVLKDMSKGIPVFTKVSRYDYEKIGASGQTQYSADGENIQFIDRGKMWYGWMPLARIT